MSVHPAQTIAANMTLIVVTILAATLIVMVPTWKRFLDYWNQTPPKPWRRIMLGSGFLVAPPMLLLLAGLISLWISTDTWHYEFRYVVILIILALSLPVYFYLIPRWLLRELSYIRSVSARASGSGRAPPFGSVGIYFFVLFRRSWRGLRHPGGAKNRNTPNLSKEIGVLAALACFPRDYFPGPSNRDGSHSYRNWCGPWRTTARREFRVRTGYDDSDANGLRLWPRLPRSQLFSQN